MTDERDKNVVDIFSAHKKPKTVKATKGSLGKNVHQSKEGYYYVAVEADERGRQFTEKDLINRANEFYYIVKVMVKSGPGGIGKVRIHNYKVPAEDMVKFIKIYTDGRGEGQIIEIDKFFQEEWA